MTKDNRYPKISINGERGLQFEEGDYIMSLHSFLELSVVTERTKRILELAHETGALRHGEFTLASGKKSKHYFDGKLLTLHPEGAYLVGKEILARLSASRIDAIGGLTIGADPIATAVATVSYEEGKPIPAFIVREERKEHGTQKKIEGHVKAGFRVVIVDDVITTGGSVKKAIDTVEAEGCKVVKVIVIVDRHEGGSDALRDAGYDFSAIIHLWPAGEATISESSATSGELKEGILRR